MLIYKRFEQHGLEVEKNRKWCA